MNLTNFLHSNFRSVQWRARGGVNPLSGKLCNSALTNLIFNTHDTLWISLLCGPISPVVNLEMLSTARFFCGNAIYGCSGLGNCRMLNFLSIAFGVIDLISMLIR